MSELFDTGDLLEHAVNTTSLAEVPEGLVGLKQCINVFRMASPAVKRRLGVVVRSRTDAVLRGAEARVPVRSSELKDTLRASYGTPSDPDALMGFVMAGYGSLKRRLRGGNKRSQSAYWLRKYRGKMQQGPKLPGEYAMVVEFGDAKRNKPAEPYLFPALEEQRPLLIAEATAAVAGVENELVAIGGAV